MEALQKMSDEPLKQCPACGEQELKKLVSAAGFRLKGAGWYETDFKSGNKKNLAAGDKSDKSSDSKSGDSKGKKEPAKAKTETKSSKDKQAT